MNHLDLMGCCFSYIIQTEENSNPIVYIPKNDNKQHRRKWTR